MGDLGANAGHFVDWLHSARQQIWQILPLNPTSHGNSPYASPSAFAGNPLLISLDGLHSDGLLTARQLEASPDFPAGTVDFGAVTDHRKVLFDAAFEAFRSKAGNKLRGAFDDYRQKNASWLDDYALFSAAHRHHAWKTWTEWEPALARHDEKAVKEWNKKLALEVEQHAFLQFMFARQWSALRRHANEKGISILGDVPIFVSYDSSDVWAHPELFKLDAKLQRAVVAGVPPDYFSEDGQLWGNPLYNWSALHKTGYAWWIERIRAVAAQVDIIRIDHFRGFAAAWEVPATEKTARKGTWVGGPGRTVFDAVNKALGDVPFVAEDLGIITPDVEALRDGLGFPGMKILQFAFGDEKGENLYLPHNHTARCVAYTGTHDNDTTKGWFSSLDARTRMHVQSYLARDGTDIAWDLIRAAWTSVAQMAIAPLQDVLSLGSEARFNTPGKAAGNWGWRFREEQITPHVTARLVGTTVLSARSRG